MIQTQRRDDILRAIADAAEGTLVPNEAADQAGAVRDLVAAMKRSPTSATRTADLVPRAWIPGLVAALLLLAYTIARPGPALVGLAGLLVLGRSAEAQRPTAGGRALAAGDPTRAAAEFLKEAGTGRAKDTAFYNAGTAALQAGRLDVARGALAEAAKSLDPGLRYRALYNLGLVGLLAAAGRHVPSGGAARRRHRPAAPGAAAASPRRRAPSGTWSSPSAAVPRRRRRAAEAPRRRRRAADRKAPQPQAAAARAQGPVAESGRADPQLDGAAGAGDPRGATAPHGRLLRRSEGLVKACAVAIAVALAAGRVGPSRRRTAGLSSRRRSTRTASPSGEELTYTLRAVSHSPVPMQVTLRAVHRARDRGAERAHGGGLRRRTDPDDGARGPAPRGAPRPVGDRTGPGARRGAIRWRQRRSW